MTTIVLTIWSLDDLAVKDFKRIKCPMSQGTAGYRVGAKALVTLKSDKLARLRPRKVTTAMKQIEKFDKNKFGITLFAQTD